MTRILLSLFLTAQLGGVALAAKSGGKPVGATAAGKLGKKAKVPTLEKKFGSEGEPHRISAGRSELPTILFLHGAGQVTQNELIGRVVGALREKGVQNDVVSLPWESNTRAFQKWIEAQPGPFVLSGHSAGGAMATHLVERYPEKFKALFLINPATRVRDQKVPTLLVRGTEDYASGREGGDNVTIVNPLHADHSLRYHPGRETGFELMSRQRAAKKELKKAAKSEHGDDVARLTIELGEMKTQAKLFQRFAAMPKEEIAKLPETAEMNREVVGQIQCFFEDYGIAH